MISLKTEVLFPNLVGPVFLSYIRVNTMYCNMIHKVLHCSNCTLTQNMKFLIGTESVLHIQDSKSENYRLEINVLLETI